ncbi:signal recognition particle protein FtsY [Chlamydia trachomatis]|nr:signal recognition particle protein FtsY [Chlamydia trachomatis]
MSDISMKLVHVIIEECKKEVKNENIEDPKLINEIIADKLFTIYASNSIIDTNLNIEDNRINVILVVGVNGSGKTTSISKIAHKLITEGKKVLIAAADTFRAAAVEQLEI